MMKRMRRKVKVMEGQILEVRKIPLMKRKKGKDVDMEEQNKMRRVMERWRRKEALNKVDDKPDDGGNGENVEDDVQNFGGWAHGADGNGEQGVGGGELDPGMNRADCSIISGKLKYRKEGKLYADSCHGKFGLPGD